MALMAIATPEDRINMLKQGFDDCITAAEVGDLLINSIERAIIVHNAILKQKNIQQEGDEQPTPQEPEMVS